MVAAGIRCYCGMRRGLAEGPFEIICAMSLPPLLRGTERWRYLTPRRLLSLLGTRDQRVFILGVNEERITLLSQQTRALNLIYALDAAWPHAAGKNRLRGARVVVIGGGAAATAAAVAGACLGADVTLLADEEILAVQRRAAHRYLHPFLYEWPAPGWNRRNAGLPLLTWDAANGTTVADRLADEARVQAQRLGFAIHENVLPSSIDIDPWTNRVSVRSRDASGTLIEIQPDLVVLGVGFGREARHPSPPDGVYWNSYWEDDDLGSRSGRVLISGQGDGGLTEVLRCMIDRFDHEMVVELGRLALRDLRDSDQILQFELDLAEDAPEKGTEAFYKAFSLPELAAWIVPRLKRDVDLVLACRGAPLQRGSSPLNRLLVAQLVKLAPTQIRLDHRAIDVAKLRLAVRGGTAGPFDVPWADGQVESFDVVVVRHGTVIPQPLDLYSGSFPPALSRQRMREPLGWALDLTRFQWWSPSTFSRCATPAQEAEPREPSRRDSLVSPRGTRPLLELAVPRGELASLPQRDSAAALLVGLSTWAAEVGMSVSLSLLARAAATQGESLEAISGRLISGRDDPSMSSIDEESSWSRLTRLDDAWATVRTLAREILILDLAGRRTTSPEEDTMLRALLAPTGEAGIEDVRAADALRRARPNDASAALAVYTATADLGLSDDVRAGSLALHALQRGARLGADGNEAARKALILLAVEEIEPTLNVGARRPGLADPALDETPERIAAGAMLLALADPVEPAVAARLVYGRQGVVSYLQDMEDVDLPIYKALEFAHGAKLEFRARWARGFSRTLYLSRLRERLGWPQGPPTWSTHEFAVGGTYDWMSALD